MSFYKYLLSTSIVGFVFAIDQATKMYVHTQVVRGNPISVINGFFSINYVRNSGGAFGFLSNSTEVIRYTLFLFVPIICVGLILFMLRDTKRKMEVIALSSILGGAAGNYIDRIRFGYVIDFIDWYVGKWHWPTFNIADSFIVIGVAILFFFYLTEKTPNKK